MMRQTRQSPPDLTLGLIQGVSQLERQAGLWRAEGVVAGDGSARGEWLARYETWTATGEMGPLQTR